MAYIWPENRNQKAQRFNPMGESPISQNKYYEGSSPRVGHQRFSAYKGEINNKSRINSEWGDYSGSRIYTKQGMLKRNDVGWDAVKLTEFVTEKIADNYEEKRRVLQRFQKEAEASRRKKKFGHSLESRVQRNPVFLPQISPTYQQINPIPQTISSNQPEEQQQQQSFNFKSVGINTTKHQEIEKQRKLIRLQQKYDLLKQKYRYKESLRKRQRKQLRDLRNKREEQEQMQRQRIKEDEQRLKIQDIESKLMNISVQLEKNNNLLENMGEESEVVGEESEVVGEDSGRYKRKRFITEPPVQQRQQQNENQVEQSASAIRKKNQQLWSKYNRKSHKIEENKMATSPTVVYTQRRNLNKFAYNLSKENKASEYFCGGHKKAAF